MKLIEKPSSPACSRNCNTIGNSAGTANSANAEVSADRVPTAPAIMPAITKETKTWCGSECSGNRNTPGRAPQQTGRRGANQEAIAASGAPAVRPAARAQKRATAADAARKRRSCTPATRAGWRAQPRPENEDQDPGVEQSDQLRQQCVVVQQPHLLAQKVVAPQSAGRGALPTPGAAPVVPAWYRLKACACAAARVGFLPGGKQALRRGRAGCRHRGGHAGRSSDCEPRGASAGYREGLGPTARSEFLQA